MNVVVVASELELANNIRIAESTRGIDVMLSADMHELTREPVVTSTGTVIVEEGRQRSRACHLAPARELASGRAGW